MTEAHACEQLVQGCYLEADLPRFEPATFLGRFTVVERRDFKFTTWVDHSKAKPVTEDKPLSKGALSHRVTRLKFWGPNNITRMAEAKVIQLCTWVGCFKCKPFHELQITSKRA